MPENSEGGFGFFNMETFRCAVFRILRILYKPKAVFMEISDKPDYIGPLIVFVLNILLSIVDMYIVYSKIHVGENEEVSLISSSGLSSFLTFSLVDAFFWESVTLLLYFGCFLVFFLLFRGKGNAKTVFSVIGYSFFVASIGKVVFTLIGSQLPALSVVSSPVEPPPSNGVSLIEMWKSSSAVAFWIFEARIAIRRAMKVILPGFCGVGMHFSFEISWIRSITAAAFMVLIAVLFFGF